MSAVAPLVEKGLDLEQVQEVDNIDTLLSDAESDNIARVVCEDYEEDKRSRKGWDEKSKDYIDLALQMVKSKTFPWPGASNVKFPLLTIAALQFSSRAYPALVRPPSLVRMRVVGEDESGAKRARAARVSEHMSYQLLDEDEAWEENHDKLLSVLPICGVAFKKSYFSPALQRNVSELVLPHECVVNYWATSIEDAVAVTHVYRLSPREIEERMRAKVFSRKDLSLAVEPDKPLSEEREGGEAPEAHPSQILEQHRWLDLDKDGLEEPYVVTVDYSSKKVLRLRHRFKRVMRTREKVVKVEPVQYFTKYGFLPAPDGSFYDLGFGTLLGPINESVNSIINQLVDSGTMQNGSRGFLGRGARFQGGQIKFDHPYEWIRVTTTGATLRDSIVPLPVNPPSAVLFNLLGLLITYGERVSSVTEMMTGQNPGQNTPAFTSQAMLEQGMQVFTGIFKRVYRNMRDEYRKLYELNAIYLNPETYYTVIDGEDKKVFQSDYQGAANDISPAADPNTALREQRMQRAEMILARSSAVPHYDKIQVERDWLEAIEHPNADRLFPINKEGQPLIPAPPDPEIEVKLAEEQRRMLEGQQRGQNAGRETMIKAMLAEGQLNEMMANAELMRAKAAETGETAALKQAEYSLKVLKERREALKDILDDLREKEKNQIARNKPNASSAG